MPFEEANERTPGDAYIKPEAVAARLGVSVRTLEKLSKPIGHSPENGVYRFGRLYRFNWRIFEAKLVRTGKLWPQEADK